MFCTQWMSLVVLSGPPTRLMLMFKVSLLLVLDCQIARQIEIVSRQAHIFAFFRGRSPRMNFHTLTGLMILIDMMLELKENARRFFQYSLLSYLLWGSLWKAQRFA